MSIYTKEVSFTAVSGAKTLVTLPCHMRGELGRLLIKQVSGNLDGYKFNLFDRRGASSVGTDLFCRGGALTSITDNGSGKCRLTVTAADLVGVKIGDTVEVKGSNVGGYNVLTHVVTALVSATTFDTDQSHTSDGTGGYWQVAPQVFATVEPDVHKVIDEVTVAGSASTYSQAYTNRMYQNRDNQSTTARRMTSALYLEIEPSSTGTKSFVISYTTQDRLATL